MLIFYTLANLVTIFLLLSISCVDNAEANIPVCLCPDIMSDQFLAGSDIF